MTEIAYQLGDIAGIFNGKTPSRAEQREVGHPVLKIRDVDETGEFRGPFGSFVDESMAAKFQEKHARADDILILNAAHNADYVGSKLFRVTESAIGSLVTGEWMIIRANTKMVDAGFLFYWLRLEGTRHRIRDLVNGIHLYPRSVANLSIPLPTLDEQRRIAAVLDQADLLRRKRLQAASAIAGLCHSQFMASFSVEMECPTHTLADLCSKITDGTHQAPKWASDGIPFIFVSNVRNGLISLKTDKFVSVETYNELTRSAPIEVGDVLYTAVGSYGNAAPIETSERFVFQRHIAHLKPKREKLNCTFLAVMLESPLVRRQADRVANGLAQKTVTLSDLKSFKVICPPMAEQYAFEKCVKDILREERRQLVQLKKLNSLFAALQSEFFGRVNPSSEILKTAAE